MGDLKRFKVRQFDCRVNGGRSGEAEPPYVDFDCVLASDYHALESQLAQANAELSSARKDAERYRWLRMNNSDDVLCYDTPGLDDSGWLPIAGRQLDAAIDAAIAREQGEI